MEESLKRSDILKEGEGDGYDILPDFELIEDWVIKTKVEKVYTVYEETVEREEVYYIKGRMFFIRHSLRIYPSFPFEIDTSKKTVSFNKKKLIKIIKDYEDSQTWDLEKMSSTRFELFDKEKDKISKKLMKDAKPMFKGLGFSEEEINIMTLGAMEHETFSHDMTPEGFIGLALRIKGDLLAK